MKQKILFLSMLALLAVSCNKNQKADSSSDLIGKSDIKVEDGRFTPDVMWALGKMGETAVSPDGSQLAYTVTYYNMDENKGNSEVYLMPTAGGEAVHHHEHKHEEEHCCCHEHEHHHEHKHEEEHCCCHEH